MDICVEKKQYLIQNRFYGIHTSTLYLFPQSGARRRGKMLYIVLFSDAGIYGFPWVSPSGVGSS